MDHEGNLVTVDDDFSQAEMMRGLAQQAVQQALKTEVKKSLMRSWEMTTRLSNKFIGP